MLLFGAGRVVRRCIPCPGTGGLGQDRLDRFEDGAGFGGLDRAGGVQGVQFGPQRGVDQFGIAEALFIGLAQGGACLFELCVGGAQALQLVVELAEGLALAGELIPQGSGFADLASLETVQAFLELSVGGAFVLELGPQGGEFLGIGTILRRLMLRGVGHGLLESGDFLPERGEIALGLGGARLGLGQGLRGLGPGFGSCGLGLGSGGVEHVGAAADPVQGPRDACLQLLRIAHLRAPALVLVRVTSGSRRIVGAIRDSISARNSIASIHISQGLSSALSRVTAKWANVRGLIFVCWLLCSPGPILTYRTSQVDIEDLRSRHPDHWMRATALRALALDAVANANSGHSGMPIGMADVATVLYSKHLKFDATQPDWPDRDRFILSAGHGSMLLYGLLYLCGDPEITLDEIKNFRQLGGRTAGHPENFLATAIETTTGPLGQGIANSVGFAMAEEMLRARFGKKLVDHHTYVIAGDGCLMEGVSHEAIGLAGRYGLGRLIAFWDNNGITIDGKVEISDRSDQVKRFEAAGWHVQEIDGHDPEAIDAAITAAKAVTDKPSMIACKTHIALGHAAQDTSKGHGALTDGDQNTAAKALWGWTAPDFEIPSEIKDWWEGVGSRGGAARGEWEARLSEASDSRQKEFARVMAGEAPKKLSATIKALKKQASETLPKVATRKASEMVLEVVNPVMPETVGGSADLTGSNNTKTADLGVFDTDNRKGRYVYWGIREHGMAAAMNGIALHGGLRPYGGTFMCFTDYARPAMRLAALMKVPTVFVMTHDSIGLGEDGPTHQPVEHLAISRATPNTLVFRPADVVETAEAWDIALRQTGTPTVMSLTRQGLPTLRNSHKTANLSEKGAYVLAEAEGKRQAIIIASGSEVEIAMKAREALQAGGIGTRVVSMPCMELFAQQDEAYRKRVLPGGPVRVAVEAGVRMGWERWLLGERCRANKAAFVGMNSFGASAPAEELFEHFGITSDAVATRVRDLLVGTTPSEF